jgi:proteasome assembly chaperone (PAC2) family protein
MSDIINLWEQPQADEVYMIAGWHQWADAGSVSSGLPQYIIQQTKAREIGEIRPDGFYLFQFPGTHDLVRPMVKFDEGYPEYLQIQKNEFFYTGNEQSGIVIFVGEEPHMDIERYVSALLDVAESLNVKRIVGLGGVYGELPYDKERTISSVYSLPHLKNEMKDLAVSLSDYQGGASIGSYLSHRAGSRGMEYVSLYAFVPTYDFSSIEELGNTVRIENDFMAWLGIMRRINYMLKINLDLSDLEIKCERLVKLVDAKVDELEQAAPQTGIRDYLNRLAEEFEEIPFDPLNDVWEDEIRRLFDKYDDPSE